MSDFDLRALMIAENRLQAFQVTRIQVELLV
jgi:hypothetical protein